MEFEIKIFEKPQKDLEIFWSQLETNGNFYVFQSYDWFKNWYEVPVRFIEATQQPFVTALYDRDPLETWVRGNVAVMGDAAHAMLPYHAQGAGQSIEDAWVLARLLEKNDDRPALALKRFEVLRKNRADRMIQHSRDAERWYHLDAAEDVERRNSRFRRYNDEASFTPQQTWLYSYDAEKQSKAPTMSGVRCQPGNK